MAWSASLIESGSARPSEVDSAGPMETADASPLALALVSQTWAEAIALELQDQGIAVTALRPGLVDTEFFIGVDLAVTRTKQHVATSGETLMVATGREDRELGSAPVAGAATAIVS